MRDSMFDKPIDEINSENIKNLKKNKIPESSVLEYKQDKIDDAKLIKEICGFANAQGGYLIFGIKESDDEPPIPKSLPGISLKKFNIQRTEQVINTNIIPRLNVKIIPPIRKGKTDRYIIVIRVPEGADKPYMSNKTDRFYLRYNYETRNMTEPEISNMYRQRFSAPQQVRDYLDATISYHKTIANFASIQEKPIVNGHIFIFPPNIERRRIEKIDETTLNRRQKNAPKFIEGYSHLPLIRQYNKFGLAWHDVDSQPDHRLEFHRNGLVHNAQIYGKGHPKRLAIGYFKENSLLTLRFAHWVYSEIGYFGPVVILMLIENTKGAFFPGGETDIRFESLSDEIRVERENTSWQLLEDHREIVRSMLDELMNHFGHFKYPSEI